MGSCWGWSLPRAGPPRGARFRGLLLLAGLLLVLRVQDGEHGRRPDQSSEVENRAGQDTSARRKVLDPQSVRRDPDRRDDERDPEDVEEGLVHAAGILR